MTVWLLDELYMWAIDDDSGKLYEIFCYICGRDKFKEPVIGNDPRSASYCQFCDAILCEKCFREHPMFCTGLERQ